MLAGWGVALLGVFRVLVAHEAAAMYNTGLMGRIETLLESLSARIPPGA